MPICRRRWPSRERAAVDALMGPPAGRTAESKPGGQVWVGRPLAGTLGSNLPRVRVSDQSTQRFSALSASTGVPSASAPRAAARTGSLTVKVVSPFSDLISIEPP